MKLSIKFQKMRIQLLILLISSCANLPLNYKKSSDCPKKREWKIFYQTDGSKIEHKLATDEINESKVWVPRVKTFEFFIGKNEKVVMKQGSILIKGKNFPLENTQFFKNRIETITLYNGKILGKYNDNKYLIEIPEKIYSQTKEIRGSKILKTNLRNGNSYKSEFNPLSFKCEQF